MGGEANCSRRGIQKHSQTQAGFQNKELKSSDINKHTGGARLQPLLRTRLLLCIFCIAQKFLDAMVKFKILHIVALRYSLNWNWNWKGWNIYIYKQDQYFIKSKIILDWYKWMLSHLLHLVIPHSNIYIYLNFGYNWTYFHLCIYFFKKSFILGEMWIGPVTLILDKSRVKAGWTL